MENESSSSGRCFVRPGAGDMHREGRVGDFFNVPGGVTLQEEYPDCDCAWQPSFCQQCRSFGHLAAGCAQVRCRNCGSPGHGAASRAALRVCHGCGAAGHHLRHCPSRFYTAWPRHRR
uniref:CCHC-type domain-containing protein n=1 Tax=Sparus aurata TaxID=8175 RepID=A0A671VCS2_SPAAU